VKPIPRLVTSTASNWVRVSEPTHVCGARCAKPRRCAPKGLRVNPRLMERMAGTLRANPDWEGDRAWT